MTNLNDLLTKIETARLWSFFHKDWLLQIRLALREQLPADYRVFVESEAVLISPDEPEQPLTAILPDVSVVTPRSRSSSVSPSLSRTATMPLVEVEVEVGETETHYSLIIRRAPDHHVVAAMELLSPSNKGVGNRWDREKHLKKRAEYLDAGISLLEIDALVQGTRDLPEVVAERLPPCERVAWTAFHHDGRRTYRGWGWNADDPLPQIDWQIDPSQRPIIEFAETLRASAEFNRWEELVAGASPA